MIDLAPSDLGEHAIEVLEGLYASGPESVPSGTPIASVLIDHGILQRGPFGARRKRALLFTPEGLAWYRRHVPVDPGPQYRLVGAGLDPRFEVGPTWRMLLQMCAHQLELGRPGEIFVANMGSDLPPDVAFLVGHEMIAEDVAGAVATARVTLERYLLTYRGRVWVEHNLQAKDPPEGGD